MLTVLLFLYILGYMNYIPDEAEFLSINQFAEKLQVHPNTIRRCILNGRLSAIKVCSGKKVLYRIPISELDRLAFFNLEEIVEKIVEKRCQELFQKNN